MKYIVIIPDGMADYPVEALGDRTPLQAAHRTYMNTLAQGGMVGLVKTIPDRMSPGSDVGNLSILGYDPSKCYTGRAPLEAANLGVEMAEDEVAFRCNLVTIENNQMADYSAGHIESKEAAILVEDLNKQMGEDGVRFVPGKSYRHLMILKSRHLEDLLAVKCTPPHDILDKDIQKFLPQGSGANILLKLMEKSRDILAAHPVNKVRLDLKENPANMIWLWGQGIRPRLATFHERFGLRGAIISAVDLVNGIGVLAGLKIITVPGITGYYDTNYAGKAAYALEALETHDIVFVHIEGPDEAGHNGDAKAKVHCIEHIDREIIGPMFKHFGPDGDFRMLVLPDHPTPVSLRTHVREPVGFVMYGKGVPQDGCEQFFEATALEKGLKFKSGEDMIGFFTKAEV